MKKSLQNSTALLLCLVVDLCVVVWFFVFCFVSEHISLQ